VAANAPEAAEMGAAPEAAEVATATAAAATTEMSAATATHVPASASATSATVLRQRGRSRYRHTQQKGTEGSRYISHGHFGHHFGHSSSPRSTRSSLFQGAGRLFIRRWAGVVVQAPAH
jgi:hypothetical protein